MNYISSPQNPKICLARALLGRRKEREKAQAFVVEGVRLLEEAFHAGWLPQFILFSENLSSRGQEMLDSHGERGVEIYLAPTHMLESLSDTQTSQGVLAVMPRPQPALPTQLNFLVVADRLRDPGNLGTLMRTAEAAGAQALIVTPGTTDPFAPKAVRAGMGAHFNLPVFALDWEKTAALVKQQGIFLYLAAAQNGVPAWKLDLRQPTGLVIGGEAEGASPQAFQHANEIITIPMPGKSESLNAAAAAAIILFELVRQRCS
ncbi:MAG TPA: RNA methyltransferase [Levilinea sp.]|nr:RNA methyltransferase [Levilinea sp.]